MLSAVPVIVRLGNNRTYHASLESDACAKPQDTWISVVIKRRRASNLTERRTRKAGARIAEIRVIEDVEKIRPEFAANPLREFEPLDNRAIQHQVARTID